MELKPGTRLVSVACTTEVIVVKATRPDAVLTCGGHPMGTGGPAERLAAVSVSPTPNALGKRYADADGTLEVLVTKAGAGLLAVDGHPLTPKDAKPLPSSD